MTEANYTDSKWIILPPAVQKSYNVKTSTVISPIFDCEDLDKCCEGKACHRQYNRV